VKPADLLVTLEELYRDKLALRQHHVAAARLVAHYEFNNTYQYVIAREDAHLAWLREAITDQHGALAEVAEPDLGAPRAGTAALKALFEQDASASRAFVEKWQGRVPGITNARHRRMCEVILGEAREHQRFFEQALEGRDDLLGRRHANIGTGGGVLPTRWVE
jgi:hypothetical protein